MTMAIKPITSLLTLSLIFLLSLSAASASIRSSSKWVPRFLGKSSLLTKPQSMTQQQYQYETRYFEQPLDHFSFADLPTFHQRYLINDDHWVGPSQLGPIFLYCGNEGDIEWFADNTGFVWEVAPRFGAMVIFPEHRYYGKSMPYGSGDEAYKNATTLSHLTAEQALADFAVLITDLKKNLSAEACPVVLFGGSYGGMLAAWMRLKYPHIAIGALASSAPVLQFEDIVPPETFYDIVSNSFRRESTSCFNTIKESWDVLVSEGLKNDGLLQLTKTFHFCQKLENTDDLSNWLDSAYSYLAMVNYPYPANFMMPLPGNPIKEVCQKIDDCPDGTSVLDRIFEGVSVYYNYTGDVDCFQLDDDPHGLDGWDWQACTEMVMPMSSSRDTSMFSAYDFNYTSFQEECWKEFRVKPKPKWITTEFGGHDFKTALKMFGSNIIFSNGLLDPWSGGSVLEDVSETIVALVTEKGLFPLAFAIVDAENQDNWMWFLSQLLKAVGSGRRLTFVSDRQHGLLDALSVVFPNAHHAYCLNHLKRNLIDKLVGLRTTYKLCLMKILVKCAYAPTVTSFQHYMEKLRRIAGNGRVDSMLDGLQNDKWANAFFRGKRYGEMSSNAAESYNNWIGGARELPITCMVDMIRVQIMTQLSDRRAESRRWTTKLCPVMEKKLGDSLELAKSWDVIVASDTVLEVHSSISFYVDIGRQTCSCHECQLNGFPCCHAVHALRSSGRDVYGFIDPFFHVDCFRESYKESVYPVPSSERFGFDGASSSVIKPPITKKQPGRNKKKRIPSRGENVKQIKCGRCLKYGNHNKKTCKAAI